MPMQYTEIFSAIKIENFIGKVSKFLTFLLIEAVLMSTHNLCLGSKVRKIGIPQFDYIKVGFKGVYIAWTCYPDVLKNTTQ